MLKYVRQTLSDIFHVVRKSEPVCRNRQYFQKADFMQNNLMKKTDFRSPVSAQEGLTA